MNLQQTSHLLNVIETECKPICELLMVVPFASGVENCVFKATTMEWGEVVIRVPWEKDPTFKIGLEKEFLLTNHCRKHNIPVPRIHYFHNDEAFSFMIQEYINGNHKEVSFKEMGKLTYQLHTMTELPDMEADFHHSLSQRIVERTLKVEKILNQQFPLPSSLDLQTILNSYPAKTRLLHMDIRPENLIFQHSKIKAVFDWTNAMIGDPVLELMRIKDYGFLNEDFISGYPDFKSEMKRVPDIVKWLYQFDTAVMLTQLFIDELQDFQQGERARRRMFKLYEKLKIEF
ncbi:aminoglycoside phosphotransferase (APT) family kinase protein [Bacillus pakistanensis]|uniref:Aminoglycoside phosphotransferase (APT) family kinase protein n=1 Tax=Rossellomorea pakistanensis TaxID=992288 RepID=A0ABS2NIT8_9BACI|nr:phosphotransferase [Bacillus pakistanensis]MBM7587689.1 aminoglycoside phosphotransferase (APT) family kinase protein [Bacillus pakistanensis]